MLVSGADWKWLFYFVKVPPILVLFFSHIKFRDTNLKNENEKKRRESTTYANFF